MTDFIFALVAFLLPLAWSPGPGNMFFAAIGARFGAAASLPASLGYHAATWIVTFAIGYGFLEIMLRLPAVFMLMTYAGSAYVLWLAFTFLRAGRTTDTVEARPAHFRDGVVLLLLNPKAYVIIVLMFTQFLIPGEANFLMLLLLITTVFTLNNAFAFTAWTLLGDGLARAFRTERHARILNVTFGLLLVFVAVWMVLR